jgi:hypothetical protein
MRQAVRKGTVHHMREESHQQQKQTDQNRCHCKTGKSDFQISLREFLRVFFRVIHFRFRLICVLGRFLGLMGRRRLRQLRKRFKDRVGSSFDKNLFNSGLTDGKSPLVSGNSIKSGGGTGPTMPRQPVSRERGDQVPIPGPEKPDKDGESAFRQSTRNSWWEVIITP